MMGSGVVLIAVGLPVLFLGFAALINHSQICLVHPGEGDCPIDQYQIALLAPLYPIGAEMMMVGLLLVLAGSAFTGLGSKRSRKMPSVSTT